jgi:glucokinase
VTVENVVSGPGLENLYWANARLQGKSTRLAAPAISEAALARDELAFRSVQDLLAILAAYASDVAIQTGSIDGVYIVGDLCVKLRALLDPVQFRECFDNKADYRRYCSHIPLALTKAADTGLRGCWRFLQLATKPS